MDPKGIGECLEHDKKQILYTCLENTYSAAAFFFISVLNKKYISHNIAF